MHQNPALQQPSSQSEREKKEQSVYRDWMDETLSMMIVVNRFRFFSSNADQCFLAHFRSVAKFVSRL